MIGWLCRRWQERQRRIDIEILWPSCRDNATSPRAAKAAFAHHAFSDPAWLVLGAEEIVRRIEELR